MKHYTGIAATEVKWWNIRFTPENKDTFYQIKDWCDSHPSNSKYRFLRHITSRKLFTIWYFEHREILIEFILTWGGQGSYVVENSFGCP